MVPSADTRRLVLRANELFHDLEGEGYEDVHPEIFEREKRRWDGVLAGTLGAVGRARTFLDVGCGTGFVGERLLPYVRPGDEFTCADISSKMLDICARKFRAAMPGVAVRTLKMDDERIGVPDASVDVLTMNSLLHHVPDSAAFLRECARVLRPGGLLFVAHEPNNRFYSARPFLPAQAAFLHAMAPKRIAAGILKALGAYRSVVGHGRDPLLESVNATLRAEGLIDSDLSRADLSRLVDVHSPTAGGVRREEGFDPLRLADSGPFVLRQVRTYNHLSKLSGRHAALRPYEALLASLFPNDGATFFAVLEKTAS